MAGVHPLVDALALAMAASETPLARAAAVDALQTRILTAPDEQLPALAMSLIELAYLIDRKGARAESNAVMGLLSGMMPRLGPLLASNTDGRWAKVRRAAAKSQDKPGSAAFQASGLGVKVRKN